MHRSTCLRACIKHYGCLIVALLLIAPGVCLAQTANRRLDTPPKLVIVMSMGALSQDAINASWELLSPNGLAKIVEGGVVCQNAQQTLLANNAYSSLASLTTATDASRHGIYSDRWYSHITNEPTHLTLDAAERTTGIQSNDPSHSPRKILVATLAESWRMAFPNSTIYSISLDPTEAILLGGRTANAALWLDGNTGNIVSSTFYCSALPQWLQDYNSRRLTDTYLRQPWLTTSIRILPDSSDSTYSASCPLSPDGTLKEKTVYGPHYTTLTCRPQGNTLIKDLLIQAIEHDSIGRHTQPDLITLNFKALENIATLYGDQSLHMADALLRFDSELADLLSYLNATIGNKKYLLVLTATHTPETPPSTLAKWRIPNGLFNPDRAVLMLNTYLKALYGMPNLVLGHSAQQIYLNTQAIENARLNITDIETKATKLLQDMAGVAKVYPAHIVEFAPPPGAKGDRIAEAFHPKRAGNLLIELLPGWVVQSDLSTQAESSSISYNIRIPLIFYGWKLTRKRITQPVHLRDIATSLCYLYHIPPPNAATGAPIPGITDWDN